MKEKRMEKMEEMWLLDREGGGEHGEDKDGGEGAGHGEMYEKVLMEERRWKKEMVMLAAQGRRSGIDVVQEADPQPQHSRRYFSRAFASRGYCFLLVFRIFGFPSRSNLEYYTSSSNERTGHRMQSLLRSLYRTGSRGTSPKLLDCAAPGVAQSFVKPPSPCSWNHPIGSPIIPHNGVRTYGFCVKALVMRGFSTVGTAEVSLDEENSSSPAIEHPPRIKFKRPDKTARHIMNILNKEAVDKVRGERAIPDVQPGCILQMRVQVPENKRRESTLKGIVIARRNAGINTTFRLRRLVAGVGVESVFPLYSPNIKEIKILDRKKVRRAKLYYLRDRMNALKK